MTFFIHFSAPITKNTVLNSDHCHSNDFCHRLTSFLLPFLPQLACLSLDHLVGTWATTPPSPLGIRTPQLLTTPPPPCTLRCRPPRSLILKHLSHTSRWVSAVCWLSAVRAFYINCLFAHSTGCGTMCPAIYVMHLLYTTFTGKALLSVQGVWKR